MELTKSIQTRRSVRNYSNKHIETEKMEILKKFLDQNKAAPFGSIVRFEIVDATVYNREELKTLGVYGLLKGAEYFIAGAVKKGPHAMEDFGYCMQKSILMATSLGLGTCWIGGLLNRSTFAKKINLSEDELLPAVSSLGYGKKEKFIGHAVIFVVGAKKRKPFEELFFDNETGNPLSTNDCGKYAQVLNNVRLAPSASNYQPWRISKEKNKNVYHFFLKEKVSYNNNKRFEGIKLQNIDMGIAMCHFEISALESGLKGKLVFDKPEKCKDELIYIGTWVGE